MNASKVKTWALVVGTAAVAIGGTWLYMSSSMRPALAQIASSGCGVPNGTSVGVPLALLAESAGGVTVAFGPMQADSLPGPLSIVFDPTLNAENRDLTMRDGTLALPTTFGRAAAVPERINVTCRDGAVTGVRYTGSGNASVNFNILVAVADAAVDEPLPADAEAAVEN